MKQKLLLKSMLLLFALIAGSSSVWAAWERVTNVSTLTAGGTFIIGYEATANSGVIIPMANTGSATTSAAGFMYSGSTATSGGTGTIDMSSVTTTTAYEVEIGASTKVDGAIYIKVGSYYLGNENTKNNCKLYAEQANTTSFTPTFGTNDNVTLDITANNSGSKYRYLKYNTGSPRFAVYSTAPEKIVIYKKTSLVAEPTFSVAAGTYTSTQSVELACATDGATIYYTKGDNPADPNSASTKYTGAITVDATTTIKAIAIKGSYASNVASATYAILEHAGTEADPYTVADARNAIEANIGITGVYVRGIVYEGGSDLSSGAMNYWISDDGTETDKFEIYKGKGIGGADFTATTDVKEGDVVVVNGNITKYNSTYEFSTGSQLVSLTPSSNPLISVTPTSLTGFTYSKGFGPSAAQTFSVEGSNLTADISLSLGESNYEMSLAEASGYTNSLTLTQSAGVVATKTIYVRLKAGLEINASYNGSIALTSTGATAKAVTLAGSVTQPNFSWDLSTNSYSEASEDQVSWPGTYATMTNDKASSTTAANNYLGGDANKRTSSRFYKDQILTIAPTSGNAISSIVFTGTTEGYATALKNSSWTNATATASGLTVTVTPTIGIDNVIAIIGATCGFTEVKVYYANPSGNVPVTPAKEYITLTSKYNLDFSGVTGLEAYIVKDNDLSDNAVSLTKVDKVPAGTGLILKASTPGSAVNVPVFDGTGADDVSENKMAGSATTTTAIAANGGYILSEGAFHPANAGNLPAGKAYLAISASAPILNLDFGGGTTGINAVNGSEFKVNGEYYNLAGQRVAQPTKGLYIVNGKKVIIK